MFYVALSDLNKQAKQVIDDLDFCNYALAISGVLHDQIGIYTGSKDNMKNRLGAAGNLLIDKLSLRANVTISTPL